MYVLCNLCTKEFNDLYEGVRYSSSIKQKMQQIIEWCRAKVMELLSKGESNQSEIARILQVDKSIVCRDIAYLRQ
jgi:transposase-like protein